MNFEALVKHISTIQNTLQAQAAHAVNLALTSRNWLMGCYIVEFEQNGEDRAAYGEQLLKKLDPRSSACRLPASESGTFTLQSGLFCLP